MDFLSAPSNLLVQCFRSFDSKDLGLRDLGMQFRRRGADGVVCSSRLPPCAFEEAAAPKQLSRVFLACFESDLGLFWEEEVTGFSAQHPRCHDVYMLSLYLSLYLYIYLSLSLSIYIYI